jgi:serine phosphatase RsbU (regulator of sigma subunit)/DNA-binding NarL/FixJ family response regulator
VNEPKPIRVMLVDDHAMVRRGLAAFLLTCEDLELVGEAASGEEAVRRCGQLQPDVVLMDMVMPHMDGAAATRAIRERWPRIQVIALTSFMQGELVQGALDAGAIGYLLKHVSADELVDAIRAAHAGRATLAPEATQAIVVADTLERLGRAISQAPPDASTLSELLREHIPAMFPDSQIEIQIFPEEVLLCHLAGGLPAEDSVWQWLSTIREAHAFLPGMARPWQGGQAFSSGMVTAPILSIDESQVIGGVVVAHHRDSDVVEHWVPAVQSLAARIASTLHGAEVYAQTLTQQLVAQELAVAGQIQSSFLPDALPEVDGWQLVATLVPARETSGDFYDVIPLGDGRLGILVADVADKGMGAALYMALCHTLIRTYAAEPNARPDLAFGATNRRILMDARAGLFVTAFYGVLDPSTGVLTYCNAGHSPPYLLRAGSGAEMEVLHRTGMALGVIEEETWTQATVRVRPGDVLLLYTDGIVDAQDQRGKVFGNRRLRERVQAGARLSAGQRPSAQEIQDALLADVHRFMGGAPQFDDIALMIVVRES